MNLSINDSIIQQVLDGGAPMTGSIALKTLQLLRSNPSTFSKTEEYNLTKRETQILEQL